MGFFKRIFRPIKKIVKSVAKVIGKVVGAITQPFGFSPDVPDFGFDDGINQESAIQGVLLNKDSAIANIPVVYGTRLIGGIRVFVSTNGTDNKYLYVALVLSEGQVNGVSQLLVDDNVITISSLDHGVERTCTTGKHNDRLKVQFFDGRDNQVSSSLLQEAPNWTSNHKLSGLAYLACRFEWKKITDQASADNNPYSGGIPNVKVKLQGKKILDVTSINGSTYNTAYDSDTKTLVDNPVSVLLDYMRNSRYGKGLPNSVFDFPSWKTAADLCEQTINYGPNADPTSDQAFTCDAVLDTSQSIMSNIKILLLGFRGIMPFTQGKYKLMIEHAGDDTDITSTATPSTVFTVTNDHIIGGMALEGESKSNKVNRCIVTYIDPNADYQPNQAVFPEPGSSDDTTFLSEDNNVRLEKQITLPTVASREQALQYAEVFTRRSRAQKTIQFATTIATANTTVGDLITVQNEHIGLDGIFRISDIVIDVDGTISITAIEHQPSTYAISNKPADITRPTVSLPNPQQVIAPTSLTLTSGSSVNLTGTDTSGYFNTPSLSTVRRIKVAWTASTDVFVNEYIIQFKLSSDSDFTTAGFTTGTEFFISPVTLAAIYDVRVAARNELNNQSDFVSVTNHTVAA